MAGEMIQFILANRQRREQNALRDVQYLKDNPDKYETYDPKRLQKIGKILDIDPDMIESEVKDPVNLARAGERKKTEQGIMSGVIQFASKDAAMRNMDQAILRRQIWDVPVRSGQPTIFPDRAVDAITAEPARVITSRERFLIGEEPKALFPMPDVETQANANVAVATINTMGGAPSGMVPYYPFVAGEVKNKNYQWEDSASRERMHSAAIKNSLDIAQLGDRTQREEIARTFEANMHQINTNKNVADADRKVAEYRAWTERYLASKQGGLFDAEASGKMINARGMMAMGPISYLNTLVKGVPANLITDSMQKTFATVGVSIANMLPGMEASQTKVAPGGYPWWRTITSELQPFEGNVLAMRMLNNTDSESAAWAEEQFAPGGEFAPGGIADQTVTTWREDPTAREKFLNNVVGNSILVQNQSVINEVLPQARAGNPDALKALYMFMRSLEAGTKKKKPTAGKDLQEKTIGD